MRKSFEKICEPLNPSRIAMISVLAGLSAFSCHANSAEASDAKSGKVSHVVDGDTFDVGLDGGGKMRVRLWGVDCPESRKIKKCMKKGEAACEREIERGEDAKAFVQRLLEEARVTVEPPFENNGGRTLAFVRLSNGEDLSRKLLEDCICKYFDDRRNDRRADYKRVFQGCRGK